MSLKEVPHVCPHTHKQALTRWDMHAPLCTQRCSDGERERARNGRKETKGEGHPEMPSVLPRGTGGRELVRGLVPSRSLRGKGEWQALQPGLEDFHFCCPHLRVGAGSWGARGSHGDIAPSQGRPQSGHLKWLPQRGSGHFVSAGA